VPELKVALTMRKDQTRGLVPSCRPRSRQGGGKKRGTLKEVSTRAEGKWMEKGWENFVTNTDKKPPFSGKMRGGEKKRKRKAPRKWYVDRS